MAYWTWLTSSSDKRSETGGLGFMLTPSQGNAFPAAQGDRLLLLSPAHQVVAVAEIGLTPTATRPYAIGDRLRCKELARVSDDRGLPESDLGLAPGVDSHRDLVEVASEAGERILATLRLRAHHDRTVAGQAGGDSRWLPAAPDKPDLSAMAPWRPESLGQAMSDDELERQAYVTVDEVIGDGVGLLLAPWPRVDDSGRLRFAPEDAHILVGADRRAFSDLLERERIVMVASFAGQLDEETAVALRRRPLQIGDVFAIRRDVIESTLTKEHPGAEGEWVADFRRQDGARVYDLSAEARQRAKLAMAAALAAPLDEDTAVEILGPEPVAEAAAETEAAEPLAIGPEGVVSANELEGEGPGAVESEDQG